MNFLDLLKVNSEKELRKIGKLKEIKIVMAEGIKEKLQLKDESKLINIKARTYRDMYNKISMLKQLSNIIYMNSNIDFNNDLIKDNSNENFIEYFKSEEDKYIYYLLELDGELRRKKLKIYKSHYSDVNKAKKWYRDIAKTIHPDKSNNAKANLAMAELTTIYGRMKSSGSK